MDEAQAVIAARREAYRAVSRVILAVNLLLLAAVGLGLPLFYLPLQVRMFKDMGSLLPTITGFLIDYSTPLICLAATSCLAATLAAKEFLTTPKQRFKINVAAMLILLAWGIFYVYALTLPGWQVIERLCGS